MDQTHPTIPEIIPGFKFKCCIKEKWAYQHEDAAQHLHLGIAGPLWQLPVVPAAGSTGAGYVALFSSITLTHHQMNMKAATSGELSSSATLRGPFKESAGEEQYVV